MKILAFLPLVLSLAPAAYAEQELTADCTARPEHQFVEALKEPDKVGRAGMVAVCLPATEARPGLVLVGGGANFPYA